MNAPKLTYNQAVFGLMLLGAKADGKLQDEEKRLLVELTSEEHHLTAEEYKLVIGEAKRLSDEDFAESIYLTLNEQTQQERVKALYWLAQVIDADRTSDSAHDETNEQESRVYNKALAELGIEANDVKQYERARV